MNLAIVIHINNTTKAIIASIIEGEKITLVIVIHIKYSKNKIVNHKVGI